MLDQGPVPDINVILLSMKAHVLIAMTEPNRIKDGKLALYVKCGIVLDALGSQQIISLHSITLELML